MGGSEAWSAKVDLHVFDPTCRDPACTTSQVGLKVLWRLRLAFMSFLGTLCHLYVSLCSILCHASQSIGHSSCFRAALSRHDHWNVSVLHGRAGWDGPHGGVPMQRRPPARSNGQWRILEPFQSRKCPSAPAQLHGRRLSLCLVNYQPAPAFTVVNIQVARQSASKIARLEWGDGWMERYSD